MSEANDVRAERERLERDLEKRWPCMHMEADPEEVADFILTDRAAHLRDAEARIRAEAFMVAAVVCDEVEHEYDGEDCRGGDIDRPHAGDTSRGATICANRLRSLAGAESPPPASGGGDDADGVGENAEASGGSTTAERRCEPVASAPTCKPENSADATGTDATQAATSTPSPSAAPPSAAVAGDPMSSTYAARLARERFGEGAWVRGRQRETREVCVIFGPDNKEIARGDTFEEAFSAAPTRDVPPEVPESYHAAMWDDDPPGATPIPPSEPRYYIEPPEDCMIRDREAPLSGYVHKVWRVVDNQWRDRGPEVRAEAERVCALLNGSEPTHEPKPPRVSDEMLIADIRHVLKTTVDLPAESYDEQTCWERLYGVIAADRLRLAPSAGSDGTVTRLREAIGDVLEAHPEIVGSVAGLHLAAARLVTEPAAVRRTLVADVIEKARNFIDARADEELTARANLSAALGRLDAADRKEPRT